MTQPHSEDAQATPATRRDGFALPLAIVVLALLTMGLVAGFAMTSSEISTTMSQRAQARAYSYAQQGLETFLIRRKEKTGTVFCPHCWAVNATRPPNGSPLAANLDTLPTVRETVYVSFASGSAIVRSTPVSVNTVTGKGTYFVTSTGTDAQGTVGGGAGRSVKATRTVGVFVTWNKTTMNVQGAWTSLSGMTKNGQGEIDGVDRCGVASAVAGVSVPAEADVRVQGNSFQPTGNPPYDTMRTFAQESSAMKMDWAAIKNGSAMPADITIPGGTFPSVGTFASDTNYWPVIHVTSAAVQPWPLPNKGRGFLIIDGDLDINGSNQWDGVILVGGVLTSNGNNVSGGATISGLDNLIGSHPTLSSAGDNAVANGQKSYVYDACSVQKATSSLARYTMMPNTWMDNISGY
ncbi:MAG: hypothetical protein ABIY52_13485 [Gemmatimonadaceae bacterium]